MNAPTDVDLADLARRLAERATLAGVSVVTAESCTGGWIAKVCTDLPGSSRWFRTGAVTYSNESKCRLLGVRPVTLEAEGAVSEAVVREMVAGAIARLDGDLGVAVSGVAGPDGGSVEKPVGTVWFAWARRDGAGGASVSAACERFEGDRESVRRWAVQRALAGLVERA